MITIYGNMMLCWGMDVSNYDMRLRQAFHEVLTCHDRLIAANEIQI
ncbi:hypothetical protein PVOR_10469 [Paenibacillus vortex V453]|uniref:Uncharacterized protein n=1 Tax=Paenibacillus vortex V453 TaxID=715225 RepID=A0A2R9SX14_9BACL|nr:hypothetical protein PVOR_10469 [Paenibacillus vortex V453]